MITFKNKGEIDLRVINTMGVSVKQGGQPFGYFGTGLKYAIAVLLREGCQVTLWQGETQLLFTKQVEEVRGMPIRLTPTKTSGSIRG